MIFTWLPFFIIAFDQITKRLASHFGYFKIDITFGLLQTQLIWNKGTVAGILRDSYYNFLIYELVIIILLWATYKWYKTKERSDAIGLGFAIGGGISNLIDRFLFGAVLDFIKLETKFFTTIFNVADMFIVIGIIVLLSTSIAITTKNSKKNNANKKA